MSCPGNVVPIFPRPGPGETTSDPWPQGLSRSVPIPSTFGVYSQIVPVVPEQPYFASQYTDYKVSGTQYIYTSTTAAQLSTTAIQFRSQAERINFIKGRLQFNQNGCN
jgi:hypothetical protein